MNRGELYWIDLHSNNNAKNKHLKLGVIVSATPLNHARSTVVIVPISAVCVSHPPIVIEVKGLNKPLVAICDQIRTIEKKRLVKLADKLSLDDMNLLDESIKKVLSL